MDNKLSIFEENVKKNYPGISEDFPRGSIVILSPDIISILLHDFEEVKSINYSANNFTYKVDFSSYTMLMDDGNVGTFVDLPINKNFREITFIVMGFHEKWDTEVTFTREFMSLLPDREIKHLINFQRAILKSKSQ